MALRARQKRNLLATRALNLPPTVWLSRPDDATERTAQLTRAYRVNLNVLALVALFTGAFLVYSLQAQAVVARRTELAFLRVAGVTPSCASVARMDAGLAL